MTSLTSLAVLSADGPPSSQFLLQVAALVTGGGIVQLTIFLLRRRSELKALDRTSAGPLLEGQIAFIDKLTLAETRASARVTALEERLEADALAHATDMKRLRRENARLSTEVAHLRTDLDISNGQVEELRRQLRAALNTAALLGRIKDEVDAGHATGLRNEAAAEGVAADLRAAHLRADEVGEGQHGEAADAASKSTAAERNRPEEP